MRSSILLSLLLCWCSAPAQQLPLTFQHLTMDDGLSQDIVTAIAQDSLGFLWFGTENGLNVYDGYSITTFKHISSDSSSISGNTIAALMADTHGRLWVADASGLDFIDVTTRMFRHVRLTVDGRTAIPIACFEAPDASIWIATDLGYFRYAGDRVNRPVLEGKPFADGSWEIRFDHGDTVWTCGYPGIHCYSLRGDSLSSLKLPSALEQFRGRTISTFFRDRRGFAWVCTGYAGVYRFDIHLEHMRHFSPGVAGRDAIRDKAVRTATEDRSGMIWIGTQSSLEIFDPRTDGIIHVRGGLAESPGFIGNRVYSSCLDRSGIVWLGTYRGGANSFTPVRQKFRSFPIPPSTGARDVYAFHLTKDGVLLVGTDNGLFAVRSSSAGSEWMPVNGIKGEPVFTMTTDHDGDEWFGLTGRVTKIVRSSGRATSMRLPVIDPVRVIFEDSGSRIWVGTDMRGLFTLDEQRRQFTKWRPGGTPFDGGVWSMFEDRRKRLWMGTWLTPYNYEFDQDRDSVITYGSTDTPDVRLPLAPVRAFREDSTGALWLATWGRGLIHLDPLTRRFREVTETDGLANNFAKSLETDSRGRVWVGTERGLSCVEPDGAVWRTFTRRDGLLGDFFLSGSSFRAPGGTLYFGGQGGFIAFDPDSIAGNRSIPAVVITSFKVFDTPVPIGMSGAEGGHATLRYDQNFFSFEFVALDFTVPERNQYAYMLEGIDRDWVHAGARRYAAYTHLDPGTYTFRVRGSNNDGLWNEQGSFFVLTITPAYWMTWWFRGVVLALVLLAAFAFYRYRMRSLIEVERLRQRIARDLHDDIGTNLSAIVLASQTGGQMARSRVLRGYLEDIRSVALFTQDQMRDIVWMLNPRNDDPASLIARMKDEAARLLRGIAYRFETPGRALPSHLDLGLKRSIFLIYKEALHNVARHAKASSVGILVELEGTELVLQVSDNGIGFDPTNVREGNGLENMRARAAQCGAKVQIHSRPGKGTSVTVRVKTT